MKRHKKDIINGRLEGEEGGEGGLRRDEVTEGGDVEGVVRNAPEMAEGMFRVPNMFPRS